MRAVRLMVRRKLRRCGQSIAVGALSQSCPSVGCTGRVACGYISQRNSTTQVRRARTRGCVLGQSPANICGGAKSARQVLVEIKELPIRYVLVDDEAVWEDVVQMLCERRFARAGCATRNEVVKLDTVYCMSPSHRAQSACAYMRMYASTITISVPNAYENYEGLRGFLDLDLPRIRRRRRRCPRLLERHFWVGGGGRWLTTVEYRIR
jgi:hypothetical protein